MEQITSIRSISRLSFWRFVRMEKCLLSGAFPEFVVPKIVERLPLSKPQALGEIFHNAMEELNKQFGSRTATLKQLDGLFAKVISEYQQGKINTNSRARHLGDISLWGEIAPIYRALVDLVSKEREVSKSGTQVFAEKDLTSKDGILLGRLDAYFLLGESIRLIDYKSGAILEEGQPKRDYVRQLYLYAHLIFETHGIYPSSMALIGRELDAVEIEPSKEGSATIANEMRSVLSSYNAAAEKQVSPLELAKPSVDACTYCDAKPFCPAFWQTVGSLSMEGRNHIIDGCQDGEMVQSLHGASSLKIKVNNGSISQKALSIARLFPKRFPEFENKAAQRLIITNLSYDESVAPGIASLTDRSQIFCMDKPK